MKIRDDLEIDGEKLAEICERYGVAGLWLFGSVLRDDFRPDSDVDLLYIFAPDAHIGWNIADLQDELENLLGRDVDLVPKRWLSDHLKATVLPTARSLYAA